MNTISTILISIFSSGIFVFIMKTLIEKSLKSYFDDNFETKKARLELKKEIISKREDKRTNALNETLAILYRNRNEYRYIFSLLCSYVDPIEYVGYEKYLNLEDNRLTIREIHDKINVFLENEKSINGKIRSTLFDNGIYFNECFQYIHDTSYAYRHFNKLISQDFFYSSGTDAIERNKNVLSEIYYQYDLIDKYYHLTREYISNYINIEI